MILSVITSYFIPKDCLESEVFDLLIAKKWALKYAVNAACTILRVRYHKIQTLKELRMLSRSLNH